FSRDWSSDVCSSDLDKIWDTSPEDVLLADELLDEYYYEINESNKRIVGKGNWERDRRSKISFGVAYTFNNLKGDYKTNTLRPGEIGRASCREEENI